MQFWEYVQNSRIFYLLSPQLPSVFTYIPCNLIYTLGCCTGVGAGCAALLGAMRI